MRPGICAASVAWLRASILASALICVAKAWLWMRTVANSACAEAEPGVTVTVHYAGVEYDSGEEFDSSWNRGAALSGQQGNIANLQFGYGQQTAANEINLGNALNAARNQPMQNLLGLGGLAIQAYTGFNPNSLRGTSANRRQGVV